MTYRTDSKSIFSAGVSPGQHVWLERDLLLYSRPEKALRLLETITPKLQSRAATVVPDFASAGEGYSTLATTRERPQWPPGPIRQPVGNEIQVGWPARPQTLPRK